MNPTNKKIVGGVLVLLFIVSIVQTQAILKIARGSNVVNPMSQVGQVAPQSACLIVKSPLGTRVARNFQGDVGGNTYSGQDFMIGISVKNVCSTKIYIIDPSHFLPLGGTITAPTAATGFDPVFGDIISEPAVTNNFKIGVSAFPGMTAYTTSISEDLTTYTSPSIMGEYLIPEFLSTGTDALNLTHSQAPSIEFSQSDLVTYGLNPNAVRKFWYFVPVIQPGWYPEGNPNPDVNFSITKLALKSLKWFRAVDFTSDSLILPAEIRTLTIPASLQADFTTSGVAIGDNY